MTVDDLGDYGVVRMDDEEIRGFLSSQGVGVLALPTDGAPSMRPLSYSFDGASALYLPYVVGSGSRKAALSDRAEVARFLVYRAETRYNWRSVLLTGRLEAVPETEWDAVGEVAEPGWRPDLFERAAAGEATALYRFRVDEWSGLKHVGLPPGFEAGGDGDAE